MREYINLVEKVLKEGNYKENRTASDTISLPNYHYEIDLREGYPLLTTKKMDTFRWDSMLHEFLWYLSGEHHIRNLTEETSIWDDWANEEGQLQTAYGRFWRRFPMPKDEHRLPGESWADEENYKHLNEDGTLDQISRSIHMLRNNPKSRRNVIMAWHPSNAAVSNLPPCHFCFVLNVQNENELHVHLNQRSADIGLGVPFNIACYSLLSHILANEADLEVAKFSHTLNDAHIYCGKGERGKWYSENLDKIRNTLQDEGPKETRKYIINSEIPEQETKHDHVPGLLKQISREPKGRSRIEIADKNIDDLKFDDIKLKNYESHDSIKLDVAV